ncbi:MAG: hypothetical protein PVI86_05895, partial [Phycisphaerae bacterium]
MMRRRVEQQRMVPTNSDYRNRWMVCGWARDRRPGYGLLTVDDRGAVDGRVRSSRVGNRGGSWCRSLVIVLAGCALCWTVESVRGQEDWLPQNARPIKRVQRRERGERPTSSILIGPSAPVANLFARAEEGVARREWKFAVDCLQRIIDDPEDSLIAQDGGAGEETVRYESAQAEAMRRLASLPPEGLAAYRLLYDGKARRLYELAERDRDATHLRTIVKRFLLTRYGDDAADKLSSWALDEGRPDEAIAVLSDLRTFVPDSDVPGKLVTAKLVAAYTMVGQVAKAESIAEELVALLDRGGGAAGVEASAGADAFVETLLGLTPEAALAEGRPTSWPVAGGSPRRRGRMPGVEPTLVERVPWEFELPDRSPDAWRRVFFDDPDGPLSIPGTQLVTDGARLIVPTRGGCVALDVDDLSVVWRYPRLDLGRGDLGLAVQEV